MSASGVPIGALVGGAGSMSAPERHALAAEIRAGLPDGTVLLETCHRVELYGSAPAIREAAGRTRATGRGASVLDGETAARHAIAVAAGRASAVLGEDQVLHQLRHAVAAARARGPLPVALDQLLDLALRAGRRARSWMPARRTSLADVAVDVGFARDPTRGGSILVVGTGEMGRRAAAAVARHRREVLVASRSPERAAAVAAAAGGRPSAFLPDESMLAGAAGIVVALAGPWPLPAASCDAVVDGAAWLVDLSAPPAVPPALASRLGGRFTSIDDLAELGDDGRSPRLAARLDGLVEETLAAYRAWLAREPERTAARALAERAREARAAELDALWERVPALEPEHRYEVERMAERLAARLLRDPLERLRADADGRHRRAARELFGL